MKKFFALLVAAMMMLCSFSALAQEVGFEETPIFEDEQLDFLNVSMVYFQPVTMEPAGAAGLSAEEANLHIEADISALENEVGFGVGDWVPYLTIKCTITNSAGVNVIDDIAFMPMAASDGPHYGANLLLPDADTYTITLTIYSPAENGYLLHVDAETGVTGRFWTEPLTFVFEGWDYVPQEW